MADSESSAGVARPVKVLVVDDEESTRWFVRRGLERLGYAVRVADSGAAAVTEYAADEPDVVLLDLKMPGMDGLQVLSRLRARDPDAAVVVMTGHGTVPDAVEALRLGAFHFVTKPFDIEELQLHVERARAHRGMTRENRDLRRLADLRRSHGGLVGQGPAMQALFEAIERLRGSDATVLITGESGTGKELVARAIHLGSARRDGPFVALHCAALAENLVESELFGHEPGAFTGAVARKAGVIERAHGGVLFLDEVADISLRTQAKLERVLSEREVTPLGASEARQVDFRLIAATNRDLDRAVRDGVFRGELFYTLDVVRLRLPPLRERPEDIPLLVKHFVDRFAAASGRSKNVHVDVLLALARHDWPGNVRELMNVVERLMVMSGDRGEIVPDDLGDDLRADAVSGAVSTAGTWDEASTAFRRRYYHDLLQRTHGNVSEAARLSGLSRGHLHRDLRHLGLDPGEFRGG